MKRRIYSIRWSKKDDLWVVWFGKERRWNTCGVKYVLVSQWRRLCRAMLEDEGVLSQLRVFGKNGRIQFEHTYGRDPKRSRG